MQITSKTSGLNSQTKSSLDKIFYKVMYHYTSICVIFFLNLDDFLLNLDDFLSCFAQVSRRL
jgi:hypothetical protein